VKERGRRFIAATLAALSMAAAMAGGSCADGDDHPPGRVGDLNYFWIADALFFNGRVSQGDTTGLADTRILAWAASGDDRYSGEASLYDIRYVTAEYVAQLGVADGAVALQSFWDQASQLFGEPGPRKAGRLEQFFLPRIDPGDTVWFAMRVVDEIGQESKTSNVAGPLHIRRLNIPVRPRPGDTVDGFGRALAGAGDLNADGYPDMLLGSTGEGTVAVVLGGANNTLINYQPNAQEISVLAAAPELTPAMSLIGDTADEFGASLAGLFNLNGDDLNDMGAGAPGLDDGVTAEAGAVFVYYGRASLPGSLSANSVDVIIKGEAAGDRFGASLSTAFELDTDGRHEFLAGAPGAYGAGAVYVFRGAGLASGTASSATALIKGEAAGDNFGAAAAVIGDVNGDGFQDFAAGAPDRDEPGAAAAGAVYVFYGGGDGVAGFAGIAAGGTVMIDLASAGADVTIRGSAPGRRFGKRITSCGNLAGSADMNFDFAVSGGDTVYVFFGGALMDGLDVSASARLSVAGEEFGAAIMGPGDLDRDGVDDLMVGAPGADAVYIFKGPVVHGAAPDERIDAALGGARFGASLAGTGDVNFDGFVDFLIGAPLSGEANFVF
jgi:hypothetical protein